MDLTPEESLTLVMGADNWHTQTLGGKLYEVTMSDGPQGLRKVENERELPAVCYPSACVLANGWDPETAKAVGAAIADECIEHGVDVLLAPAVNIKRSPLCGRNFEYFSEDPYLAGKMAAGYIAGVQEKGVGACLKHFCANNMERDRLYQSSEVDEKTLRNIYLEPFRIAIAESRPWTAMISYNLVNGVRVSENPRLMTDLLRGEFGFDGAIISDWGAVKNPAAAISAGLDLIMPQDDKLCESLRAAAEEGKVEKDKISASARRVAELASKCAQATKKRKAGYSFGERKEIALRAAEEGITLLKNEEGILPLKKGTTIAVIGQMSEGRTVCGGGSGSVAVKGEPADLTACLKEFFGEERVKYSKGINGAWGDFSFENFAESVRLAASCDCCIVCAGNTEYTECEGFDRTEIKLNPKLVRAIRELSKVNPNLIVELVAGSAVDVSDWIDCAKALLYVGFGGQEAQRAAAEIFAGKVCPSGKLSETFPLRIEDTPAYPYDGDAFCDWYREGPFVGYRHYDRYRLPTRFPFGFGLSYAKFEYTNCEAERISETENVFRLSVAVKNISDTDGKETVEVYIARKFSSALAPVKELKAFLKKQIKAGGEEIFSFVLGPETFVSYSSASGKYELAKGEYELCVGASAEDIKYKVRVTVK